MIFAKIDFINLLPFYVFIKKNIRSSQNKAIINYKKSYPAKINKQFINRKIDAAFISSIKSRGCKGCLDIGIVAQNEVLSVLCIAGEYKKDYQSDTSNMLAVVLGIEGRVLIGDKALQYYHTHPDTQFIDLALAWKEKTGLPFVFARLCTNKHTKYLENLSKRFLQTKIKIPQYILKNYAQRSGLSTKQITQYLEKISYNITYKEKQSLKKFLQLTKDKS